VISARTTSLGNAGEIEIDVTERVNLSNGGSIFADTSGAGNGGDVNITAADAVLVGEGVQNFEPVISVEASGAGQPGDITISTPNFVLSETARITATATATATNTTASGSITLNADRMDLAGTVGIFAETQGQAPGGTLTLQPFESNPNLDVTLASGSIVSASTSGSGNGGSLAVRAPNAATVSGPGRLEVRTTGSGQAGTIEFDAQQLTLADGVEVSTQTDGSGDAGVIRFANGGDVQLNNTDILSDTNDTGNGGDISFTDLDSLTLNNSTVTVDTAGAGDIGDGIAGSIDFRNIGAMQLNNSRILSSADAFGTGGNITFVDLEGLSLNDGTIESDTEGLGGNAGSIFIQDVGTFSLENDSLVLAAAASGANDGDIDITAGLVTAVQSENNDIIANAVGGTGGAVTITAIAINNLTEREGFTVNALRNLDTNDVSASATGGPIVDASGSGSGLEDLQDFLERQGSVDFFSESFSPSTDLPDDIVDADVLIAGSCIAHNQTETRASEGSFILTGSSGLPQQPGSSGFSTFPVGEVRTTPAASATEVEPNDPTSNTPINEPDGLYQLADGRLVLSHACDDVIPTMPTAR
ncbi:MAG: hypothetical protein AAFN08_09985, partial [Cyanobacteria bacterium J06559_3]